MNNYLFTFLFQREYNAKLIFSITVKLIFAGITGKIFNNKIEKLIEKYINSDKINSLYVKNLLKTLQENFTLLKRVFYGAILGLTMTVNLEDLVQKSLLILKILGDFRSSPPPSPEIEIIREKLPEIRLALKEFAQKNSSRIKLELPISVKVAPPTISVAEKRTCEIFEKYIFTQPELLKTFEREDRVGMKERLTTYCTTKVTNSVKRLVEVMRRKSVTAGLQTVKAQSYKALKSIEQLPKNSQKSKDLTIDLLFTTRCIDSWYEIFRKETTMENLEYFKEKMLPDFYILFYYINNEAKK